MDPSAAVDLFPVTRAGAVSRDRAARRSRRRAGNRGRVSLGGWYFPARGRRGAVLVCNGNGGDRSLRAELALALNRMGLSVLLFDYRGYGGNPGMPSEGGLTADARAALDWLGAQPFVTGRHINRLNVVAQPLSALRTKVKSPVIVPGDTNARQTLWSPQ